jgi:hypothetical protein
MVDAADFLKSRGLRDEDAIVDVTASIFAHACGHFQYWRMMDQAHVDAEHDWCRVTQIGPPRPEWLQPLWSSLEVAMASDPYLAQAIGQYFSGLAVLEIEG